LSVIQLFLDPYLSKFLDTWAKFFFPCYHIFHKRVAAEKCWNVLSKFPIPIGCSSYAARHKDVITSVSFWIDPWCKLRVVPFERKAVSDENCKWRAPRYLYINPFVIAWRPRITSHTRSLQHETRNSVREISLVMPRIIVPMDSRWKPVRIAPLRSPINANIRFLAVY